MNQKLAARAIIAGIALTALGLVAASPASAHTNNAFTHYTGFGGDVVQQGFATIGKTDGTITPLTPTQYNVEIDTIVGQELTNETGTAIGRINSNDGPDQFFVITWDHSTGVESAPVPVFIDVAESTVLRISGLDTLADGTLITFVTYTVADGPNIHIIAKVNPSGLLTELIHVDDLVQLEYTFDSLATDPISGVTYAFLGVGDNPYFVTLDFTTPSHGVPVRFAENRFGYTLGADFDVDGTLYFYFGNNVASGLDFDTLGSPTTWATATPTTITSWNGNDLEPSALALTLEHTTLPATGSGLPAVWLAAGGFAVLAGAVTVVVTRRRKTGAVV